MSRSSARSAIGLSDGCDRATVNRGLSLLAFRQLSWFDLAPLRRGFFVRVSEAAAPEGRAAQERPAWKVGCPLPLDACRSPVPKSRGASKVAGPGPKSQIRKNVSAASAAGRVNALDYRLPR